jgi:hypothetical protein
MQGVATISKLLTSTQQALLRMRFMQVSCVHAIALCRSFWRHCSECWSRHRLSEQLIIAFPVNLLLCLLFLLLLLLLLLLQKCYVPAYQKYWICNKSKMSHYLEQLAENIHQTHQYHHELYLKGWKDERLQVELVNDLLSSCAWNASFAADWSMWGIN